MNRLTTGAVAAVGVGVGAALAASLGPVAYALAYRQSRSAGGGTPHPAATEVSTASWPASS